MDSRKKFLSTISGLFVAIHLGLDIGPDIWDKVTGSGEVEKFLEEEKCILLYSHLSGNEVKQIQFQTEVKDSASIERCMIFYKTRPCVIREDNYLKVVNITSIQGSVLTSLFYNLNNVFGPLLSQEDKKSSDNYSNIGKQISTLQAGLRSTILTSTNIDDHILETDHNSLDVILTIENELEYWTNVANSTKSNEKRKASLAFKELLKPLAQDLSVLDAVLLSEVEDTLEKAHNTLDDLWRNDPPFPKNRTTHLIELIASSVVNCIENNLRDVKLWDAEFVEISNILQQCISIGSRWLKSCQELTQIFWPNYSLHMWTGPPVIPDNLVYLINRLKEVLNVRTVHKQLVRLLTNAELEDLNTEDIFKPFRELDILECGPHMDQQWIVAKKKFEYLLQPAEHRVGVKLRKQLSNVNTNTRQLLHEFGRYSELIDRPVLKQSLLNERQYLLNVLQSYVKKLSSSMADAPNLSVRYDTPQVVSDILATRQLEARADEVQRISDKLLSDLQGYNDLKQSAEELISDLKQQHNELFDSWAREINSMINDHTLSLKETDPVVQFTTQSKLMKVNYSSRLVILIQEVRQLSAMGYSIPQRIEEVSVHAKQFIRHAKVLEQIANFHNTIGDRMLPSQRPMMLASAVELSKLVQEQEVVSWGDVKSVENYVQSLQAAVEKLSKEDNLLRSYHEQIMKKIDDLEDVDIIRNYQKWRDASKEIRELMYSVQQKGFKNMNSWKMEVDVALAKVLEKQYVKSLETLHLYLPEIYADLIYRDKHLEFSPNEVILKEKYEQQLKRFLEIPKSFRGVADNPEPFLKIVDKSQDKLSKVSKNTDNLFEQLRAVVKHWESWLTVDSLDVSKLKNWQHWDVHFRGSKAFGQEVAKLPSTEEHVGCFVIGLSRLRSDLESHNRSYWDQLTSSLKDAIAEEVVKLQAFIDTSTSTLNKPLTFDQVEESDASHAHILQQTPEMEILYKEMMQKARTLASWSREKLDSVNRIQAAWERLQSLLENHQHIIAKQIDTVKMTLNMESENLNSNIERFAARWDQVKPRPNSGHISTDSLPELYKHLENIREKREQWKELCDTKNKLLGSYKKFNMEPATYPLFEEVETDLENQENTWQLFEEFYNDYDKMNKEEWIVFRKKLYLLEEFVHDWQVKLQKIEASPLVTRLMQEVLHFKECVPCLKYLRGEDFTDKHWMEAFSVLGIIPKALDTLYLKDFLLVSNALIENVSEIQAICKRAASEVVVRQALAELDQWDMQAHFVLIEHIDSQKRKSMLIKDFKEILNKIGDNQSLLQSVKNSSDYESFSERAGLWESRLADLDFYLTSLSQIQRKWVYLEPIFGSGTLIQEKSRFDRLDKDYRNVLNFIEKDTRVCGLCRFPNLRSLLENIQDQLSRCQQSLDNFLAEKRNKFPRFFFLGDDDLLEVVGQSSKEQVIQAHLKKLFAGIHGIELTNDNKQITTICSLEGEKVSLSRPIDIEKPVEEWLNSLVGAMQETLKQLTVKCVADGQNADPLKYPSQVLNLSDQINFTSRTEQAITNVTLPSLLANYKAQLVNYNSLDFSSEGENSLSSASGKDDEIKVLELKIKALLLNTIHHIQVLEELIEANVTKLSDWSWSKQLRYYADNSGNVNIKMVNSQVPYSYEYQGNSVQLVRTPLTDKCFLTLMQAIHLGMGGNPYGPAGTGKTESVKALGNLLGRQVLVFNCDEGIDSTAMGCILSGLVQSGAWGCFDEFNRLDEATLSTISMHIQIIQNALSSNKKTVILLDNEIKVNEHCGIFVTLNPAGEEYGGRNKLPDNLKQLFRPIVMTHPDHEQIARTLLHLDGFKNADVIGRKLIEVFDSATKLLSKQQHYDWSLRALRTVLGACTNSMKSVKNNGGLNLNEELTIVVKAIRMNTLSKLTYSDGEKFDSLLKDVFPGIKFQQFGHEQLTKMFNQTVEELGLIPNERQISKCVELYEQLKQRMGVALVGPPNSGKTTIRKILFHTMPKLGKVLKQHVFNPKSMPRIRLLGHIDMDTRQWSDGVLTLYSALVAAEPKEINSWIVCDGDVDPEWVESLNSVLDDNRLLSLPSGCNIKFGPNVNFIFETHDMSLASPATISRMGIIFLSEEDLDPNNYLSICKENANDSLKTFLDDYIMKAIDWAVNEGELLVPRTKISLLKTTWSLIKKSTVKAEFTTGLLNGICGQIRQDFREAFAQYVFQITAENAPVHFSNFYYNKNRDMVDCYLTNVNEPLGDISNGMVLFKSAQVKQIVDCLSLWLTAGKEEHFLMVGPHGSAKLLMLKEAVKERSDVEIAVINCCAQISVDQVVLKMAQHCMIVNSTKGRVYKPRKGHLIMYFRNLHLLKKDQWGTNMLIEFLTQLVTSRGFYDANLDWIEVVSFTVVGSFAIEGSISSRFTSIMNIIGIELPPHEDLQIMHMHYLSGIVKEMFPNSSVWSKNKLLKLTNFIMNIYSELKSSCQSQYQHYKFNPHDITMLCSGLMRYSRDSTQDVENYILEVICQEAMRIFSDRLITDADRNKFYNILNTGVQSEFGRINILADVTSNFYVSPEISASKNNQICKLNVEDWKNYLQKGVIQYERDGQVLDILLIQELMQLSASLSRILTNKACGNAVLVGRAGIGRRTALKITTALHSCKLIAPSNPNQPYFNNDLKMALQVSGIEGEPAVLLLQDFILNNDNVLTTINMLISSGEVLGLYNSTELDSLVSGLKDDASRENFEGSPVQFFAERILRNLHVVICLEEDNPNLMNIFEHCPALHQNCSVIWQNSWGKDTLDSLPNLLIARENNKNKTETIELCSWFSEIQSTVNSKLFDPIRYLNLIKMYMSIYVEKKRHIVDRKSKLMAGVSKLTETKNVVAELKLKAKEQQEKLADKQAKANSALDMISNTMKNANTHKEEMEVLKKNTEKENEQLIKRKAEIEVELAEVEPLIEEARLAVGNIKNESLSEIRSLRAPPEIIRDILEGVLRLMGIQDTSWNSMKVFLAKRGVKEDIRSFDASRINIDSRNLVEKLINTKKDSFDPKAAKRASVAAAPLAAWVVANVKYSHVLDKIKPLEKEQNKLKKNLESAEMQLGELSAGLLDVDSTVAKLKGQLSMYTKEAAEIEIHLNKAQETLKDAEELVGKLDDEYERWKTTLQELSEDLNRLSLCCLFSSAFITYLSAEPEDVRSKLFSEWIRIVNSNEWFNSFTIEEFLSTEQERMQWQSEGLPLDKLSIQNAIILSKSNVPTLIIDPTSGAFNWMKNHLKNVEIAVQNSPKFNTTFELAVRFGKKLIIEEVEDILPCVYPILKKEFIYQGERKLVSFNGKVIDYHKDFSLILFSRNENLKLSPDISMFLNIVNFTITRAGLCEQLLNNAIKQESPQLEERRLQLSRQREEMQEKLYNFQNQLLEDLANSTGDILQNKSLITSLNETKSSSDAISKALIEFQEIQHKLKEEYDVYREISQQGSLLYFAANEYSKINIWYSLSVSSFTRLFLRCLPTAEESKSKHGKDSRRLLVQKLYGFMGRGIFKADRIKFVLHLVHKLFPDQITEEEWRLFLGQVLLGNNKSDLRENLPSWLPEISLQGVYALQCALPQFYTSLKLEEQSLWKNFMEAKNCESEFPTSCSKLTEFQKVLVVQALRPDRLYSSLYSCALHLTGLKTLSLEVLQLSKVFKETLPSEPIFLITSGSDPSLEIKEIAKEKIGLERYVEIPMGEGQEEKAFNAMKEAVTSGYWLTLKNVHLVTNYLPVLTQLLQQNSLHEDFRLWLLTEPCSTISPVLAQNCLKIAYEAPQSIKNNITHSFNNIGANFVQKLNPNVTRVLFALTVIHAVIQERRSYIPQGWSKYYEFSDVDLSSCVQLVLEVLKNIGNQIPWKFLINLCSDAIYGGRIESLQDLEVLEAYLRQYLKDDILSHRWKFLGLSNTLPTSSNFQEYLKVIQQLSNRDLPAYFQLPENIDRSLEKSLSLNAINILKELEIYQSKSQPNSESMQKGLLPFMNLWKKLNQGLDFVRINAPSIVKTNSPVLDFISEEYASSISLIQKIHKHFANLNRLMKGSVNANAELTEIANSLISLQTPKVWLKLWSGPKEPAAYLRSVINKTIQISKWAKEKNVDVFLKIPLNISYFFSPITFLQAVKQDFSRKSSIPMDELHMETYWKEPSSYTVVLNGLLIEGALFDGLNLSQCLANSENINPVPNCYINWTSKIYPTAMKHFEVPLYYSSDRKKQLMVVQVPNNSKERDAWVLSGLFLSY